MKGIPKRGIHHSFRFQILVGILGAFFLLVLSTAYILFCAQRLQDVSEGSFEQERYIKSIQEDLAAFQGPFIEYLSTRSSNAHAEILIGIQSLRQKVPARRNITGNRTDLKERELYFLILNYLDMAEKAMEEKRGRNIAYTKTYEEMARLLDYINRETGAVSTERFRSQLGFYEQFLAESGAVQLWNFLFIISISVFTVSLLLLSVNRFTNPLVKLSALTKELSSGNFNIPDLDAKSGSIEEMNRMIDAFNHMKNEIGRYIEEIRWQENIKQEYMQEKMRNMKMEGLVRHMEIYALQAQMNPHFLFNTINTGMQLAIVEGADRTGEYMDYMARLFRHIIRNKEIIVPLRHEIEGLEFYFYILKVRFPLNLELELDYEGELLDKYKVPVSILQPLVENCVIHAFKDQQEELRRISVGARLEGRRLVLSVRDNGRGMAAETAEQLLHPHSLEESSMSRVMGLENVIQRLYFFYPGDREVAEIQSGTGGTSVIIRIDTEKEPCIAF
ncbi:MAG: histidine kinase [Treponema sp.]|jgi:sensor histidine kinase YesM|nr:histidine kinase [Treponema sp.]